MIGAAMSYPRSPWRGALPPMAVYGRHWARWAVGVNSLTARLRAASSSFRVELLGQGRALPLRDEWRCLGLPRAAETLAREVLLICDEAPVVYAHTIVHPRSVAADWPFLRALGTQPLGHALFADPRVARGPSNSPCWMAGIRWSDGPTQRWAVRRRAPWRGCRRAVQCSAAALARCW